jgi:hypothetical protein
VLIEEDAPPVRPLSEQQSASEKPGSGNGGTEARGGEPQRNRQRRSKLPHPARRPFGHPDPLHGDAADLE